MGPMLDIRSPGSFADTLQSDPEAWALRINAAWRRSLESVLETGRLLIDAKARLRHGQWETMIATQLDFSPSTVQRLMIIARDDRLSNPAHGQLLPRSYRTLYELTKLSDAEFTRGITEKIINPDMDRVDVEIIRPTPRRAGGIPEPAESGDPDQNAAGGVLIPSMAAGQSGEQEAGETIEASASGSSSPALLAPADPAAVEGAGSDASTQAPPAVLPGGGLAIAHHRIEPAGSLDFFPTPPWATRALFEHVLKQHGRLGHCKVQYARDPCCGEGHMSEVMKEYFRVVIAGDVGDYDYEYEKADFLQKTAADGDAVDWIIMNSPFGQLAEDFCLKSIQLAGVGVAMLVRLQWLETPGRYERIFKNNPPSIVAVFSERVPIHKGRWVINGKTMTAYVWMLWIKGMEPQPIFFIPPGCRVALTKLEDAEKFGAVWEDDEGNIYPTYEAFKDATSNDAPAAEAAE